VGTKVFVIARKRDGMPALFVYFEGHKLSALSTKRVRLALDRCKVSALSARKLPAGQAINGSRLAISIDGDGSEAY